MPNIKSVMKDVIKSRKNRQRNASAKSAMKTHIKKAKAALEGKNPEAALPLVKAALSVIDKTAERGIIHRNAAARRKSRLMKRANKAIQSQS